MLGMILPNTKGPRYHRGIVLIVLYYHGIEDLILYCEQYIDPIWRYSHLFNILIELNHSLLCKITNIPYILKPTVIVIIVREQFDL